MREGVAQWLEEGGREEALNQFCTHPLTLPLETHPGGVGDLLVPNTSQFPFFVGEGCEGAPKKKKNTRVNTQHQRNSMREFHDRQGMLTVTTTRGDTV